VEFGCGCVGVSLDRDVGRCSRCRDGLVHHTIPFFTTLAHVVHNLRMSAWRKTRIVCISDTHNQTPKLPPGDVLIHAGDLTNQGSYAELKRAVEWLERQEFEAVVVIAGT
jgi:hypothetical protein